MMIVMKRLAVASTAFLIAVSSVSAEVIFERNAQVRNANPISLVLDPTEFCPGVDAIFNNEADGSPDRCVFFGDYFVPDAGFVRLLHLIMEPTLRVTGGSTLGAGLGIFTTVADPFFKSNIFVDGPGSRIQIGSDTLRRGNIRLNGKGDFDITNGGVVEWIDNNNCTGDFLSCDILIGADNGQVPAGVSNTGIRVLGPGSLLDASDTGGRLFVGFVPSIVEYTSDEANELDSEDFFVIADSGTVRSSGGSVGKGFEGTGWDASTIGFVQGTAFVDDGSWFIQGAPGNDSSLNIGEGDGGSGNVIVTSGGLINITANAGSEAGFFAGQTEDGVLTQGASNLVVIDGAGSTINVDNNAGVVSGSRVANAFVTVQNGGALQLDSSVLVVSGNSGATLSDFNNDLAINAAGITGLANINLDVLSGGAVSITDADQVGLGALVIGQTPDAGPVQSATVRVSGAGSEITVSNDPALAKIPLSATAFNIPTVSNIGTGTMDIEAGASVAFNNGDFVIAARDGDDAVVTVDAATLAADRVVVGWTDFEGGLVNAGASTGVLTLDVGIVDGDVIVDDNGTLNGIGTINGTLFLEGGSAAPGFSPGTIVVESLVMTPGSRLVLEAGLNPDGTIDPAASDLIVATAGDLDLSQGEVTIELYSVDPATTLEEVLALGEPVAVDELLDAGDGALAVDSVAVTDSNTGEALPEVEVINVINKAACKDGGWEDLSRDDDSGFKNQGDCIQYVNTGK